MIQKSERFGSNVSYIDIAPSQLVQVSRTDFLSPTLSAIVSDFGGAMGIWLGMGVTQLIHLGLDLVTLVVERLRGTSIHPLV